MAGRNRKGRNGGGNHHHKTICWFHKSAIKGKVWYWNGHQVCKKCHDRLCEGFISGRKMQDKILKTMPPQRTGRGLLARIFNW